MTHGLLLLMEPEGSSYTCQEPLRSTAKGREPEGKCPLSELQDHHPERGLRLSWKTDAARPEGQGSPAPSLGGGLGRKTMAPLFQSLRPRAPSPRTSRAAGLPRKHLSAQRRPLSPPGLRPRIPALPPRPRLHCFPTGPDQLPSYLRLAGKQEPASATGSFPPPGVSVQLPALLCAPSPCLTLCSLRMISPPSLHGPLRLPRAKIRARAAFARRF